jgi:protein-S-isoprenylcysteine O-methyltransferase Ste14
VAGEGPRFKDVFEGSGWLQRKNPEGGSVITLGVILLIIGFIAKIAILWTIGIILVVIGLILVVLGMMGRAVGGRAHYY